MQMMPQVLPPADSVGPPAPAPVPPPATGMVQTPAVNPGSPAPATQGGQ